MELGFGINNLINTPLWGLIQEKINNDNLEWIDALVSRNIGGKVRDKVHSELRKSKIAWIDDTYLRTQIFHSVNLYNKQQWNYDLDGSDSIQYGIYSDGGHYDWHIDKEPNGLNDEWGKTFIRKLSMTIWLNDPDEYEGGELDIELTGPRKDPRYETFKLSKGSILIFQSDKWHRVRPVTCGVRKSLVTWFRGAPFR